MLLQCFWIAEFWTHHRSKWIMIDTCVSKHTADSQEITAAWTMNIQSAMTWSLTCLWVSAQRKLMRLHIYMGPWLWCVKILQWHEGWGYHDFLVSSIVKSIPETVETLSWNHGNSIETLGKCRCDGPHESWRILESWRIPCSLHIIQDTLSMT